MGFTAPTVNAAVDTGGGADGARCITYTTHPDLYHRGDIAFVPAAVIRSGPFADCPVRGIAWATHGIDVHCVVANYHNRAWYFVRNTSTGVNG